MIVDDQRNFRLSNKCWICDKLYAEWDNKVRDHDRVTDKYRGSAHKNCNINLRLTKKIPVVFHNLRSYGSHLLMQEIGKFNIKLDVIPNGLENCFPFTVNRNLVFTDSIQFMNSNLDVLVKNLSENDFKYLSKEFTG